MRGIRNSRRRRPGELVWPIRLRARWASLPHRRQGGHLSESAASRRRRPHHEVESQRGSTIRQFRAVAEAVPAPAIWPSQSSNPLRTPVVGPIRPRRRGRWAAGSRSDWSKERGRRSQSRASYGVHGGTRTDADSRSLTASAVRVPRRRWRLRRPHRQRLGPAARRCQANL